MVFDANYHIPSREISKNLVFEKCIPFIELAKYFEHVQRDFPQAFKKVQEALNWLDFQEMLRADKSHAEVRKALSHRLRRIRGKLEGARGKV